MREYFNKYIHAAPLSVFRIGFGLMLFISVVRFWSKGWIEDLYITPKYFFSYYGFEFIVPPGQYTYLLFAVCGLSAFLVAIGLYYRASIITLFLSFTYIELIDKTTYLNHYYFVSVICLMMIFLPAGIYFSVDAWRKKRTADQVPKWTLDVLKLMVCMLYFFAGLAKINSDWLLHAIPLKIWLPAKNDTPLIGFLFNYPIVHFLFSWFGCIYDLCIPFLLWNKRTQPWAYLAVIVFHVLTAMLFQIGMFPYVMIVTALIFFPESVHLAIVKRLSVWFRISDKFIHPAHTFVYGKRSFIALKWFFIAFFVIQLLLPFRYLLYPGNLFWTEEGYRFSWRVMLMEKAGYAQFTVKDSVSGKYIIVNNNEYLTPLQEKMMSTQPDMMLQYAHILRDSYKEKGFQKPQVYVDAYVAMNGRRGKVMIDPHVDLAAQKETLLHKNWILPY